MLCDPQIVGQMPDEPADEIEVVPHVDQLPEWANGRPYLRIVGLALTPNVEANGGLTVWPLDGGEPRPVELARATPSSWTRGCRTQAASTGRARSATASTSGS